MNARIFFFSSTDTRTTELVPRISFYAFHSFVVDSSEIAVDIYVYKKGLSNAKNRVELEILSFLSSPFLQVTSWEKADGVTNIAFDL